MYYLHLISTAVRQCFVSPNNVHCSRTRHRTAAIELHPLHCRQVDSLWSKWMTLAMLKPSNMLLRAKNSYSDSNILIRSSMFWVVMTDKNYFPNFNYFRRYSQKYESVGSVLQVWSIACGASAKWNCRQAIQRHFAYIRLSSSRTF